MKVRTKVAALCRCLAPLPTDADVEFEVDEEALRGLVKALRRASSRYAYPASDTRYNRVHDAADAIERDVLKDWR